MIKLHVLLLRHWQLLLGLNLIIWVGIVVGKLLVYEPMWETDATLVVPDTTSSLDANLGPLGSLSNDDPEFSNQLNPLKLQISILNSDVVMEQVLSGDPLKEDFLSLERYKKLFDIFPEDQSTTIHIAVAGPSADIALHRSRSLIRAYQARLNELRVADSSSQEQFSAEKVAQARADLQDAQSDLVDFQESSRLVNADVQTEELVKLINEVESRLIDTEAIALTNIDQVNALVSRLGLTPEQANQALGLNENQEYRYIRGQLAELSVALANAEAEFTPLHPRVQLLRRQQSKVAKELQQYLNSVSDAPAADLRLTSGAEGRTELIQQMLLADSLANAQINQADRLRNKIASLDNTLNAIPEAQSRLLELRQNYDVAEGIYKGLVAQTQQSNIHAFSTYPSIQVLDPPRVEPKPIGINWQLLGINALLASVVLSTALLMLLESQDPLLSPQDLRSTNFQFITRIPHFKRDRIDDSLHIGSPIELQWLASTINAQPMSDRTLLVASSTEGEGKTAITLGLAIALVELGFKVLVIDADQRRKDLSQRLGVPDSRLATEEIITVRPNLDLKTLPFDQHRIENRLGDLQTPALANRLTADGTYDYVVIDSPAFTESYEASSLSQLISHVLFVVRPGVSSRSRVQQSLDQLSQHSIGMLGLVVNGEDARSAASYSLTRSQTPKALAH